MRLSKMEINPYPHGFPHGNHGILTTICEDRMQASCGLKRPLTVITVFFHIRPSKGNNPSLLGPPYIYVSLSWEKTVISVRRPFELVTVRVLPSQSGVRMV